LISNKIYKVLGTDGFGHSDTRERLRAFFEVDRYFICLAVISALIEVGDLKEQVRADLIRNYKIDTKKIDPMTV